MTRSSDFLLHGGQESGHLFREIGECLENGLWKEAPHSRLWTWIENEALSAVNEISNQNASATEESKLLARFWGEPGSDDQEIRRLLVIDDDPIYCTRLKETLERLNFREFQTANEAANG